MNNAVRHSAALCLVVAAAVCVGGKNADATLSYGSSKQTISDRGTLTKQAANTVVSYTGGDPYAGRVAVRGQIPGSSRNDMRDSGTGSASLTRTSDGKMQLTVVGSIRNPSDASSTATLTENDNGWITDEDGMSMTIGSDGKISGSGVDYPNRLRFDGFISEETFDLTVETELLEANQNNLPPGTKITYSYDLNRTSATASGSEPSPGSSTTDEPECERIVWQTRNVANLGGGPMIMTQVPVCVD